MLLLCAAKSAAQVQTVQHAASKVPQRTVDPAEANVCDFEQIIIIFLLLSFSINKVNFNNGNSTSPFA